jgi:hypothetical protein
VFQIMILICAIDIAHSSCQPNNASDVIRGPEVANELMCGLHGQAFLASTTLAPRSGREYLKIQCLRSSERREARREAEGGPRD